MATHRFRPTRYFNVIGTAEPGLQVADGDTLIADTVDASGLDASEAAVAERPNPMTGPFFIEGAEPGDTLAVRIDRLTPSRATGWTLSPLAFTVLDPAAIPDRPRPVRRTAATWITACLHPARPHGSRSRCREHSSISAMATPARATVRLSVPASRPPSRWR
jgi:acetamidase/formamidase